jgi:hypothetical protein
MAKIQKYVGTEFGLVSVKLSLQPQIQTVKKTTWFLFFIVFAVSCLDEPECYLLNNDMVGIYFRVMGSNQLDSANVTTLLINGTPPLITEGVVWQDLADNVLTGFAVPLDYFNNHTDLDLVVDGAAARLPTEYQVQTQYVSEECGPRYVLSNLRVDKEKHGFDSVRIVNSSPSRDNTGRHIEIFRCPVTDTLLLTFYQLLLPSGTATPANRSRPVSRRLEGVTVDEATTLYAGDRQATLRLPVSLTNASTRYGFAFSDEEPMIRNLEIRYTTTTAMRYGPCGIQTFVSDLAIADNHNFDSVSLALDANGFPNRSLTDPYSRNINVYRCPTTNIIQFAFRRTPEGGTTPQPASVDIVEITADYSDEVYYADSTTNVVQLPLNLNAGSTVFTLTFEDRTETITVNYTVGPPPQTLFRRSCKDIRVVTNISISSSTTATEVVNPAVVFPTVTNVNVQVP